jgi:hypothetical protein
LGVLDDDKDVLEMVKHLGSHTEAAGHVYVGTIQVKKLQALCYWVHDHLLIIMIGMRMQHR